MAEDDTSLEEMLESHCKVNEIHIKGLDRTSEDFVREEIASVLAAKSVGELSEKLFEVSTSLRALDIFSSVDIEVDAAKSDPKGENLTDVSFSFEEKKNYMAKVGTYSEGSEGSLEIAFALRNIAGRAQKLESNFTFGTNSSSAFRVNYSDPRFSSDGGKLELSAFRSLSNHLRHSAHFEQQQGLSLVWTMGKKIVDSAAAENEKKRGGDGEEEEEEEGFSGKHTWRYDLAWRTIRDTPAAHPVAALAGHSLKSSLSHNFTYDERDHPTSPTRGAFLSATTELAGLGGDMRYFKHLMSYQLHLPFVTGLTVSFTGAGGAVFPLGDRAPTMSDLLFLGGGVHLRGFRTKGVGPRAKNGDDYLSNGALGGDLMSVGTASLVFDPAHRVFQALGLRLHVFGCAGNNASVFSQKASYTPLSQRLTSFLTTFRSSFGFGMIANTRFGRLELNYCFPLRYFAKEGDRIRRGVQIGLDMGV